MKGFVHVGPSLIRHESSGRSDFGSVGQRSARYLEALGAVTYLALWCAAYDTGGEFSIGAWSMVTFAVRDPAGLLRSALRDGLVERTPRGSVDAYRLASHFKVDRAVRLPSDAVRHAVYERDHFRCVECGATDDLTVDHIVAWSLGGLDDPANLQTLCRPCNSRKGDRA